MHIPPIKVAIQGDKASFHEIAALQFYTTPIELVYCDSFEEVFAALQNNAVDKALVAVSNSAHGDIENVTSLMARSGFVSEGEHLLFIQQHLIGLPSATLKDIQRVVSHPIALSQCNVYLKTQLKTAVAVGYHDTSAAVEYVKQQGDRSIAAIGSEAAAKLYGLKIIQRSVQNDPDNATLFKSLRNPIEHS
jgi:prephenate dehydratase